MKPTSLRPRPRRGCAAKAALPTKNGLVVPPAAHPDLHRVGQPVGVLPDNDVTFFQTKDALRLDAERSDAGTAPGFQ